MPTAVKSHNWLGFGIESGAITVRLQEARVAGLKEAAGV